MTSGKSPNISKSQISHQYTRINHCHLTLWSIVRTRWRLCIRKCFESHKRYADRRLFFLMALLNLNWKPPLWGPLVNRSCPSFWPWCPEGSARNWVECPNCTQKTSTGYEWSFLPSELWHVLTSTSQEERPGCQWHCTKSSRKIMCLWKRVFLQRTDTGGELSHTFGSQFLFLFLGSHCALEKGYKGLLWHSTHLGVLSGTSPEWKINNYLKLTSDIGMFQNSVWIGCSVLNLVCMNMRVAVCSVSFLKSAINNRVGCTAKWFSYTHTHTHTHTHIHVFFFVNQLYFNKNLKQ